MRRFSFLYLIVLFSLPAVGQDTVAADREIDPFQTLHFDMNVSPSKFRLAASRANSIVFNRDGKVPTKNKDKTTLTVAKSFANEDFIEDKKQFAISRFQQFPLEITSYEAPKEVVLDEIAGYEINGTVREETTGRILKIVYVLLFSDNAYYVFVGTTYESKKNEEDLRRVIRTFKRR
jgi:hypothetical protein